MSHTPLPWKVSESRDFVKTQDNSAICRMAQNVSVWEWAAEAGSLENRANAELIVRAVNSHEILIEAGHTLAMLALQSIRYTHNPDFRDAVDDLLAAIKPAEAEVK